MILFPAIDIRGGKCVRLIQGDYTKEVIYNSSPISMAIDWEKQGAKYIHVVDLDGAKTGDSLNERAIKEIVEAVSIPIQVGGGIRTMQQVDMHLSYGVSRVIIGTAAIENPEFLKTAVVKYGSKVAVSIDARNGYVATDGWTKTTSTKAITLLADLVEMGVKTIVYTDILKDGMLAGPNFVELAMMNNASTIDIIASGGVTTVQDIKMLKQQKMYGAIIGKALYEGKLSLTQLMEDGIDGE